MQGITVVLYTVDKMLQREHSTAPHTDVHSPIYFCVHCATCAYCKMIEKRVKLLGKGTF